MATIEEALHLVKLRLQDQQAKLNSDNRQVRAELDALWACVEVLAQAVDGQESIEIPDYFGDSQRRLPGSILKRSRRAIDREDQRDGL